MLIVGPKRISTPLALASLASSFPSSLTRSKFQVDPTEIAHGKQAEGSPDFPSPLTPFGPSDILRLGIFNLSILFVYQAS